MSTGNNSNLKEELRKYKQQYNILVVRCNQLEGQLLDANGQINFLRQSLFSAQKALDINKDLLRRTAEEHNKKEQSLVSFMNKLKDKLRELGYADFNNLGDEGN